MIDQQKFKLIEAMTSTHEEMQKCVENLPATETMLTLSIKIPLHDKIVTTVQHEDEYYVPIKALVEGIGLSWSGQLQRIKRDEILNLGVKLLSLGSGGGAQKAVCLPLVLTMGWLYSIDVARCRPEVKEKLNSYKRGMYGAVKTYENAMLHLRRGFH